MMGTAGSVSQNGTEQSVSAGRILLLSAAFGIVVGLVEGLGLLIFHGLPWFKLNSRIPEGVSIEILWISPVVNLLFFLALGLVFAALLRFLPRLQVLHAALFLFTFLAFVDWVGLTGHIAVVGILALGVGFGVVISRRMFPRRAGILHAAPKVVVWGCLVTLLTFIAVEGGLRTRENTATAHLPVASKTAPNVLVIVVDTLRADHLSLFGYARPTSPHLDAIARQGASFEDAISTSSWTLPAHQGFLTGRYPHEQGPLREQPVNPNFPTLAEAMDNLGYRTGAFSANTDFFCRRAGFARGFLHFEDYFYSVGDMAYRTFWGRVFAHDYVAKLIGLDE